jgi:hypothetical protein
MEVFYLCDKHLIELKSTELGYDVISRDSFISREFKKMKKFHQFFFVLLFGDLWYLISCNFYFQDFNETAGLVVSNILVFLPYVIGVVGFLSLSKMRERQIALIIPEMLMVITKAKQIYLMRMKLLRLVRPPY